MVDDLDAALDSVARGDVMPFPSLGDRLRETMPIAMQGQGPDYEADLQRAARATGVPIPSARSYPDVVKARARSEAIDYDRLAAETPATAGLLADLDKARIAHDDTDNLTFIERALNGLKKVPGTLKASYYDAANAGAQMRRMIDETSDIAFSPVTALIDAYVEAASPDLAQKLYRYDRERKKGDVAERAGFQRQAAEAMPEVDSFLEGALLSGVRSLPLTVSAIGAGVATGSPGTGLALMGTTSASSSYGEARDAGLGVGRSLAYGLSQGTIEAGTEKLPLEFITKSLGKVKMGKFLGEFVVKEMAGEQVATVLQDMNDWHALNPDKSMGEYLSERPRRAAETAIATLVTAGALGPVHLAARVGARAAERRKEADESAADAQAMGQLLDAAAQSRLRERDTDAFRAFIEQQTDGTAIGNTYIPAQAVAEYFQSQGVDWHSDAFFGAYSGQIDQGLATGGDVVIPTADVMAGLAGTDALTALRPAIRTSPDGMSLSEAEQFQNDYAAFLEQRGEEITAQAEAERAAQEPAQRVYDDVLEKMRSAGFTLDAARQYASLYAARYNARASRFETDAWTEYQQSGVEVQQVLPEALAPIVQADQLDLVINALKGDKKGQTDRDRYGASLVEWIAERGGVEDIGGDLKSMGADNWQKAKPFRKKVLRPLPDARQGSIAGMPRDTRFSLDTIAHDAWERGYFPNMAERPTVAELLDAIGQELSGTPRYVVQDEARTATYDMRAAAEDLRLLLEETGVDWQNATRAQIRAAVDAFRAEVEGGYRQEQRGSAQFSEGRALIQLFQSRDLSTFLHETGHLWLEELKFDATRENAPDALKADWETVKAWFAANGHAVADDGTIPVEAHELWARGVERYTMEGKAPSSALRRAFDAFRSWLLSIYQVVDRLRSPITPEVREVMDRMIATDEELAQAREEQNLKALFTSAEQAGMTDAEFEAYQRTTVEARDEAYNELVYRTMAAIRKQRTQEWRDDERAMRAEVSQRVDARPEFRALRLLRTGKLTADAEPQRIKLDKEWLIQTYGADALQLLPKGVPPIYTDREATSADVVAELTGYQTGDELVLALMGLETRQQEMRAAGDKRSVRQQLIDEETAAEMRGRYGDPLNDGSIEEEALAAVHNERQGEIIASEVRTLTRRTREGRPTPYRLAREWARGVIQRSEVREATTGRAMQRYARAAAKASRAAEKAMLAGDIDETFRQKQAHLLNHALLVEAKAAADEVNKAVDRLGKIARRKTMKSVDQDYLEQAHGLLEQFDFRPLTAREIKERESFAEWAARQQANGIDVVAPQRLMNAAAQHYSKMSVEELAGLDATVKQILHLGRTKKKLLDAKEEREFDDIVDEAIASAAMLPPRPPSDLMEPSFWDAVKSGVASVDASLLKVETIFDWLDSKNPNGVFNRVVFRRIADAQDRRHAMMKEYTERLVDLLKAIPKPQIARWAERVTAPELFNRETGNPWVMTREQLVSIALNMGNASNADKLTRGYGWSEDAVMAVLNRELSAADWQYVQGVWDTIESLWPEIAALERRVNGVEPEKVEARALETSSGQLRGGYFPVVYDPTKSVEADMQAAAQGDALFENFYTRATTPKGFTKERTTVARPIHLSLGIINRHVSEVIHDITHREAIMDADRFLGDKRVMKAIDQSLGPEYRKQLRPWLQHVANEWAADREAGAGIDKFIKKLRTNTTIVGMGYRFSTMFMQIVGYSNSFEVVGVRWVADGVRRALQHPIESWRFVAERSGEAVQRVDTMDRDIRDNARQLAGRIDPLRAVKQYAFYGIGMMDRVVVTGTWIGAYNKALASGASEADAAYAADKAIRQSQGSGAAKDLARVQRGTGKAGEALKILTMFYSYMSAFYQRERQLGRDIGEAVRERRPGDFPGLLMRAWWLFFVPAVLSELVAGRGPEEDEDWGLWAFQQMLVNALGPIPVVRDIAAGLESGFGYKFSPAAGLGTTIVNTGKDVQRILEGEETKRATRNAMEAVGYATGLVPGQIAATTQFFVDVAYGDQDPETLADWWEGITKGKVSEE